MFPAEISGRICYHTPENPNKLPQNFITTTINFENELSVFQSFKGFAHPAYIINSDASSTPDEEDEANHKRQNMMTDERTQRRRLSNRDSARRSRVRKQRHVEELCSQLVRLTNENRCIVEELNRIVECHERAVEENSRLKEETSDLKKMITEVEVDGFFYGTDDDGLRDFLEFEMKSEIF